MRNIPIVTKNLLIINVAVFLVSYFVGKAVGVDNPLADTFGLHFFMASDFMPWQLVTYMFMHGGWEHIIFNMFALWMFGCVVERVWGAKKFLFYYLACGVGAGLFQEAAQFVQFWMLASDQVEGFNISMMSLVAHNSEALLNQWTTVGASGAIYAILLAFGMIFPDDRIFIFPLPVPIKAKYFVIGYAVIELFSAMATTNDGVAHIAHLGGMVFGFFLIRYWRKQIDGGYSGHTTKDAFGKMRGMFGGKRGGSRFTYTRHEQQSAPQGRQDDWQYNARKKATQEEIDRILDKIRRNGYDSLTREEKQSLFDQSNR